MSWWKRLTNRAAKVFQSGSSEKRANGCRHDEIHLRQGTAEFEWFISKAEFETGHDLTHGMRHLGNLLSYDPGRAEWVELLEGYLAKADPNPESLLPDGEPHYYTSEAVRAYCFQRAGKLEDAVNLLANVARAKISSRYLETWCVDWLTPPGQIESISSNLGLLLFSTVLKKYPEARQATIRRQRDCEKLVNLAERFFEHQHEESDEGVMLRVGLLRRAGRFDDAFQVAQAAYKKKPGWHNAVATGLVLRQKGDPHAAETWFRKSLEHDPADVSSRLEAGDTYFEREDWPNALRWYDEVLQKEPKHSWAKPSALFCQWKQTGKDPFREELLELAKTLENANRAHELAYQAYMPDLSPPTDASANMLRQISESMSSGELATDDGPGSLKLTLNMLEAPSNVIAFRLEMDRLGRKLNLKTVVEAIQKPDPREPLEPVKYLLWKFEGTDPRPALAEPSPTIVDAIATLAKSPFNEWINWADASRLAVKLGVEQVQDLLAVMVFPPACPKSKSALDWLPRVQLTVCQVLAHIDEGWEDSVRREALYSVLLGPSDWTTTAAIQVLARIGREEEVYAPDIHEAFRKLAARNPNRGYCCWLRPLYSSWLELPHLFPKEREEFQAILKELDREES